MFYFDVFLCSVSMFVFMNCGNKSESEPENRKDCKIAKLAAFKNVNFPLHVSARRFQRLKYKHDTSCILNPLAGSTRQLQVHVGKVFQVSYLLF